VNHQISSEFNGIEIFIVQLVPRGFIDKVVVELIVLGFACTSDVVIVGILIYFVIKQVV
jgi:hypothetical protein